MSTSTGKAALLIRTSRQEQEEVDTGEKGTPQPREMLELFQRATHFTENT